MRLKSPSWQGARLTPIIFIPACACNLKLKWKFQWVTSQLKKYPQKAPSGVCSAILKPLYTSNVAKIKNITKWSTNLTLVVPFLSFLKISELLAVHVFFKSFGKPETGLFATKIKFLDTIEICGCQCQPGNDWYFLFYLSICEGIKKPPYW